MNKINQASVPSAAAKSETRLTGALWRLTKKFLADGANAWNITPKMIAVLCALPFIVALTGVITGLISKDLYKWFTREDGFAESMQVLFYSAAFVLSLAIIRHLWSGGQRGVAFLYVAVSFGLFFLIGEELSWGQRLIGWETPESLASANKQAETNLHNIYGVGAMFKWIQLMVGAYGTILPLIASRWSTPAQYREITPRLIPHLTLVPYFVFHFAWRLFRNLVEVPPRYYFAVAEYNEVMELILAMGLFLFMVFQIRRLKAGKEVSPSTPMAAAGSPRGYDG